MATEQTTYNQPTNSPTSKVAAGGIAGTIATIVVFILGQFGIIVPAEVAAAFVVLVTFLVSYFTRNKLQNA